MSAKGDITSPDDLALDSPDGFSKMVDPCTDLACKLLATLLPNAICFFSAPGILLFLRGKYGRTTQEKRTKNRRRREGRGCEQCVEVGTKGKAILFPGETVRTIRLGGMDSGAVLGGRGMYDGVGVGFAELGGVRGCNRRR